MRTLAILGAIVLGALLAGAVLLSVGFYDVAATRPHFAATYRLMETGMRESVKHHSRRIEAPPLDDRALVERGLGHYREHCVRCHGGPGVAPEAFALGMVPAPANLAHTARLWRPAELFWVIKHGIKMTGMPAWEFRMADDDIWSIVAFMQELPKLSPQQYQALQAPKQVRRGEPPGKAPDPERGKTALPQYACITCHQIPGVVGANAPVGPPLEGIGTRAFLAGVLPNTPENMVRWIREPQKVNPRSAMPDLGVTERDARDIAAYLSTLK